MMDAVDDALETPGETYKRLIQDDLWGLSSHQQPVREDIIDQVACTEGGMTKYGTQRGFTRMKVTVYVTVVGGRARLTLFPVW